MALDSSAGRPELFRQRGRMDMGCRAVAANPSYVAISDIPSGWHSVQESPRAVRNSEAGTLWNETTPRQTGSGLQSYPRGAMFPFLSAPGRNAVCRQDFMSHAARNALYRGYRLTHCGI